MDNDKPHFQQLLAWTEDNLAGGDLTAQLPAWNWGHTSSGSWAILDSNSAADADVWMAYTLLEAGRLWKDPRYERLGSALADRIERQEVVLIPGLGTTLAPGPHGFHPDEQSYVLNPSYLPLSPLVYLARVRPQGPWSAVLDCLPAVLSAERDHGFAMDWVVAGPEGVRPAPPPREPTAGTREAQAGGSYDAIRVYLWLGLADPRTPGRPELLSQMQGMLATLRAGTNPPGEIDPEGRVVSGQSSPGFAAAVVPFLQAFGLKRQAEAQSARLLAAQDAQSGLYGKPGEYYDQNLALFSTGWSAQLYRFERDGKLHLRWK